MVDCLVLDNVLRTPVFLRSLPYWKWLLSIKYLLIIIISPIHS